MLVWPTKLRIYYGVDKAQTIVLLGGDEDGQTADLNKSQEYWNWELTEEPYFDRIVALKDFF